MQDTPGNVRIEGLGGLFSPAHREKTEGFTAIPLLAILLMDSPRDGQ